MPKVDMTADVKTNLTKWLTTAAVICANLILWAKPCNLAYNVAQQRHILLGRYTIDRATILLLLIPVSLLIIKGIWSTKKERKTPKEKREHRFKVIALSVSIIFSIVIADIFLRLRQHRRYVGNRSYYHRAPNTKQQGINKDVPPTAFSYPIVPAGYPDIPYTLTVDKRGFRNDTDFAKYDAVVLGDSFTEGSHVSDDQSWPFLFAQKSNLTVYNLGMSGGSPLTYLETLKKFGLELSPKIVVCMLYEGNDFRSSNFSPKKARRRFNPEDLYKASPLRHSIKKALIQRLGPINSNRKTNPAGYEKARLCPPSHPLYAVSWLPLAAPDGPNAKYYAFKVKRLLAHFVSKDDLLNSTGCKKLSAILLQIKQICTQNNIRFIVAYAPDKPHTLLPLIKHKLSPEKLHAFMALKKKNLPPPDQLIDILLTRLHSHESAAEEFCRRQSIEFISLTEPLRRQILKGRQAYFTYDQHWTPIGTEIAADTLHRYIKQHPHGKTD